MKSILLDTNILIRFTTGEPAAQAEQARQLLVSAETSKFRLTVVPMVLAEAVFVLTKFYEQPRQAVAAALTDLLSSPVFQSDENQRMLDALKLFGKSRLDFVDCFLAAISIGEGTSVASFDQDLRKLSGVNWIKPGTLKD